MYNFDKACYRCHWFKNGTCLHNKTFRNSNSDSRTVSVYYLAEEGVIREAVKEGFTEKAFSGLKGNLESKLSKRSCTNV